MLSHRSLHTLCSQIFKVVSLNKSAAEKIYRHGCISSECFSIRINLISCHFHRSAIQNDFSVWNLGNFLNRRISAFHEPFTLKSNLVIHTKDVLVQKRQKSYKKTSEFQEQDQEEDDLEDDALEADDFEAPPKFKVIKIQVASLRSDTIISHALNIARNRMDEMFLGSSLLLNGEKMKKKAVKMDEGDYVDVIIDKEESQYKVKRVKLLKVLPERTASDKFIVKVRVWRTPFMLDQSVAEKRHT